MQKALSWVALTFLAMTSLVQAQTAAYPTRPIRLIVPFAPGGAADQMARMISEPMAKELGQPIIVENKPGGGATVGAALVASAAPDGYTVLYTTPGPQIINPYLMGKLPYNPDKDLIPVSRVAWFPNVLVVAPKLPVNTVQELIEYARKNPGKTNFGSSGIGASTHLSGELFKSMAGVDITHVPYKGSGQVIQDLLGGNVQLAIDSLSVYIGQIRAGNLRALGVASPDRSPLLPDVPAISEQLKGYEAVAVNYLSVPAGTSRAIIDRLNAALRVVIDEPALKERMINGGIIPKTSTPEEMANEIEVERIKWKKVIAESGAKAE
ncbi:MAG: tripartite tricarboxylate transporter substrate binding protein [Alcaligenaceae bacterium]